MNPRYTITTTLGNFDKWQKKRELPDRFYSANSGTARKRRKSGTPWWPHQCNASNYDMKHYQLQEVQNGGTLTSDISKSRDNGYGVAVTQG